MKRVEFKEVRVEEEAGDSACLFSWENGGYNLDFSVDNLFDKDLNKRAILCRAECPTIIST